MSEPSEKPKVTVIVPSRNEAAFIEPCLRSILANDYPRDRTEVLVVDGQSTDGTADVVRRLAQEDPRVRLIENPRRVTPVAFNLGIAASTGDIVCIVGGHTAVAPDFISRSVRVLQEHPDAWVAGGSWSSWKVSSLLRRVCNQGLPW